MILEGENYRFQRELLGAKGAFRLHLGLHLASPAGPLSCECEVCLRFSAVAVLCLSVSILWALGD
jgi:hypothetical protein